MRMHTSYDAGLGNAMRLTAVLANKIGPVCSIYSLPQTVFRVVSALTDFLLKPSPSNVPKTT